MLRAVGGFFIRNAPVMVMTKKIPLRITQEVRQPKCGNRTRLAIVPKMAEPPPYPASARPMARPILSGNHLAITGTTVP